MTNRFSYGGQIYVREPEFHVTVIVRPRGGEQYETPLLLANGQPAVYSNGWDAQVTARQAAQAFATWDYCDAVRVRVVRVDHSMTSSYPVGWGA